MQTIPPSKSGLDIPALLKRLPLFSAMTTQQIGIIGQATRQRHIAKGIILFQKGDIPSGFYVVVSGQIKLAFPSSQGNEKVVEIVGPSQSFGEAVMFMGRPYPVFAEALSDTQLVHIQQETVFNLTLHDSTFARSMLAGLSIRIHSLVSDVESYSLRSSTQRVIGYLLQLIPPKNHSHSVSIIALPTSKQVIASRLNLTPETLSRIFHELVARNLIRMHGRSITIPDLIKLQKFDQ